MKFQKFVNLVRPRISHTKRVYFPYDNIPFAIFAEALKTNKVLLELNLTDVVNPELLEDVLIHMMSLKCLSIVYTRYSPIYKDLSSVRGSEIAIWIASVLKVNTHLKSLTFRARILKEGAVAIAEALKVNITLTFLDLSYNDIEDIGAAAIIKAVSFNATTLRTKITALILDGNRIGDRGANAIAEELKENTNLTELRLASNLIGNKGAIAIADAICVNKTLITLSLSKNMIGPKGGIAIGKSLNMNSSLRHLDMEDNSIGNKGALAIAKALVLPCITLQELILSHNNIQGYGVAVLLKALEYNRTLEEVHLLEHEYRANKYIQTCVECVNPVIYPMERYGIVMGTSFCPTLRKISIGRTDFVIQNGSVATKLLLQKLLKKLIGEDGAFILSSEYQMKTIWIPYNY
jgi:Ran GTPase-activating protein (RanGAP) involved in mRNA processing and transport